MIILARSSKHFLSWHLAVTFGVSAIRREVHPKGEESMLSKQDSTPFVAYVAEDKVRWARSHCVLRSQMDCWFPARSLPLFFCLKSCMQKPTFLNACGSDGNWMVMKLRSTSSSYGLCQSPNGSHKSSNTESSVAVKTSELRKLMGSLGAKRKRASLSCAVFAMISWSFRPESTPRLGPRSR